MFVPVSLWNNVLCKFDDILCLCDVYILSVYICIVCYVFVTIC
jgi:hypothetical protein